MKISIILTLILLSILVSPQGTQTSLTNDGTFDSTSSQTAQTSNQPPSNQQNSKPNPSQSGNTQTPSSTQSSQTSNAVNQNVPASNQNPQQSAQSSNTQQSNPQNAGSQAVAQAPPENSGTFQAPKILLSEVNKPIVSKGYKVDNGVSYQRIKIDELQKKYLFFNFKLSQKDKWQNVNITITNEGSPLVLNKCEYTGMDSCFIPAFVLKAKSILFVSIQCQDDCTYNLNVQWNDTQHLIPNQQVVFMFGKDTTQIYHVQLDEQQDFQQVRIHIAPRVTRKPFDNVKIYGKFGKQKIPSAKDYDFKSVNLWQDGQGIFLKKDKLKKNTFVLLIIGQSQTTYRMLLQVIKQQSHEIEDRQVIYEYLQAKSTNVYHIKNPKQAFEEYSLRFSTLSGGDLDIGYYTDKQTKNRLNFSPLEYMRDTQYILNTKDTFKQGGDGIYIKVNTKDRDATFTIKLNGRNKDDPIELSDHVYGFIFVLENTFAFFDFKRWASETQIKQNLKFTAYIINVVGKVQPQFYVCLSTLGLCTNPKFFTNTTALIPIRQHHKISQKDVYQITVDDKLLTKINSAQQQATLIVKFNGSNNTNNLTSSNIIAVQLVNNNKVSYLRQGRPLEQKLGQKQMKIYKYINSDPNVQQIRIHINQIAGHVTFSGVIQSDDNQKSIQILPQVNTLRFTSQLTQPIYASVTAQSKAIFGISMQVIHKSQQNVVNIVSVSEDLTYTVRIPPNTYSIYQITPIFYQFQFSYSATQTVIVCPIVFETNTCFKQNGQDALPNLSVKGVITNGHLKDRKSRIKITNPFSDSVAQVSFIFHSRLINHCQPKQIGHVYNDIVKDNTCYSYLIQQDNKILDIYISKRQFANLSYNILLCGTKISFSTSDQNIEINQELINKYCIKKQQSKTVSIIWGVNTKNVMKTQKSVKVDLLAQFRGDLITLSQGVGYTKIGKVQQGPISIFAYKLINKKQTKIILTQVRGRFKVYAKLVIETQKQKQKISNIDYHFASSQKMDYSQNPIVIIPQQDIKKIKQDDSAILVAVYSENDFGAQVQFDIQIVQRYYSLSDDTAVEGYLQSGSTAYYTYVAKEQQNSTILVIISDHNQKCANMYLSLQENPGPHSNILSTSGENEMIFNHPAGQKKYFLAVSATKICDYSISVLTIDSSIHNLKRGKQNLIKFPQGVIKYFYLDHYTNEPFKIIALAKYGDIRIYINQSSIQVNKKSFTTTQIQLQKFEYRSQLSNTLSIDSKNKIFCQKCSYFIAVQALKNTQATLYLVYPQTTITLTQGHFLSDYFTKKNDYTIATYNRIQKTQINIKVHKGSINLSAFYKDQTKTQKFTSSNNLQNLIIDFQIQKQEKKIPQADPNLGQKGFTTVSPKERIPINIMVTATSDDTFYTLELVSLASNNTKLNQLAVYQSLIPGQPNNIQISSSKPICVTGYLRNQNEELILSTSNDNKHYFNQLIMQASYNKQKADIQKKYIKNILSMTLSNVNKHPNQAGAKYELCIKLQQQKQQKKNDKITEATVKQVQSGDSKQNQLKFMASITQINTVNILPSDIDSVVKGQSTYVVHSDGEFLLDVFQCKGQAKVNYGTTLENIQKSKLKMLDMVSMADQRHAIKISQKQTTFVRVKSQHAVVRWLPIDYQNDRGIGYVKYSKGDLKYSSKFKEIIVQYQPLQINKQTRSQIKQIEYHLYLSNSSESLEFASQCESNADNVKSLIIPTPSINTQIYSSKVIQKEQLQKLYPGSENIYFNIVVKVTIALPSDSTSKFAGPDEHQHYRFIYSRQQIPLVLYQQNQIESIPYHYLILLVLSVAAILILFTYLFTRKIVPMIARLKTSNLVEEQPAQQPKDDLEVPASSDRNQRAPDTVVQTQQKMG